MSDQPPPECGFCGPWTGSVSRIDRWQWYCACCGRAWPVGQKKEPSKTDLRGVPTDQDDG